MACTGSPCEYSEQRSTACPSEASLNWARRLRCNVRGSCKQMNANIKTSGAHTRVTHQKFGVGTDPESYTSRCARLCFCVGSGENGRTKTGAQLPPRRWTWSGLYCKERESRFTVLATLFQLVPFRPSSGMITSSRRMQYRTAAAREEKFGMPENHLEKCWRPSVPFSGWLPWPSSRSQPRRLVCKKQASKGCFVQIKS